jgi:hypothetical protein
MSYGILGSHCRATDIELPNAVLNVLRYVDKGVMSLESEGETKGCGKT